MYQPRDRFGGAAGRFYERGLARTPTGRQRIRAREERYVRKTRPAKRSPARRLHPFQWLGFLFCLGALVVLLFGAGHGKSTVPPASLLIVWGCMFTVLGQQAAAKKRREQG